MRCRACNCVLTDFESTRKNAETGEYLDLCAKDARYIETEVPLDENTSLITTEDQQGPGDDEILVSEMRLYQGNKEWDD